MVLPHSLFRGDVAEYVTLLLIGSSHASLDVLCAASLHNLRIFPQPARRPGISLKWKGTRIRGVNWNIRHDNLLNGEVIAPIYGWHEKQYTEIDEDKHLVDINDEVKNADLRSIIQFCCDRWNIESPEEFQYRIGDL
jgi:hypothetical protein